jgi:hypothetical protein
MTGMTFILSLLKEADRRTGHSTRETDRLQKIGRLNQLNLDEFVMALQPLLLSDGFYEKSVEIMFGKARHEISEVNVLRLGLRLFSKWYSATARKGM